MGYLDIARNQIRKHEGVRNKPYMDTQGHITIGIGRNLDQVGLLAEEIEFLFQNDLKTADITARKLVKTFEELTENRKAVILGLAFNLGETRLSKFVKFLKAINESNFEIAAKELESSLWYFQVGTRGKELVSLIRSG